MVPLNCINSSYLADGHGPGTLRCTQLRRSKRTGRPQHQYGPLAEGGRLIPLYDDIPGRRFPVVNVALIVANFAVFLLYELPDQDAAINQASFYPCDVTGAC